MLGTDYASMALRLVAFSGPTNAVPPRLGARRDPDGQLRLRLSGAAGLNHVVQGSTNLADWITLLTTNTPSGVMEVVDPQFGQFSWRFYRAFTE
jgi:hypothetical protein